MAFKLKYKNLKGVIEQLKGASKKHKKQAEILEKHVDKMKSPLEQEDNLDYTGLNFDPSAGYTTTGVKIPSFRDMVSLEQQQAIAKRTDERRAKRKQEKEEKRKLEAERRADEFLKNNPIQNLEEQEIENPLSKYVVNQPLNLPEINVKTEDT